MRLLKNQDLNKPHVDDVKLLAEACSGSSTVSNSLVNDQKWFKSKLTASMLNILYV